MKFAPAPNTLRTFVLLLSSTTVTGLTPAVACLAFCSTSEALCGSSKSTTTQSNFSSARRHRASGYPQPATPTPQRASSGVKTAATSSSFETKSALNIICRSFVARRILLGFRASAEPRLGSTWQGQPNRPQKQTQLSLPCWAVRRPRTKPQRRHPPVQPEEGQPHAAFLLPAGAFQSAWLAVR